MTWESEFDWRDRDDIAVPHQPAIAVYLNPKGDIVIRQEDPFDQVEDPWIVVCPSNVGTLIEALAKIAGIDAPTNGTHPAAERDAVTSRTVTPLRHAGGANG